MITLDTGFLALLRSYADDIWQLPSGLGLAAHNLVRLYTSKSITSMEMDIA